LFLTSEEEGLLPAVVAGGGEGEGCVHMVRDLVKADTYLSRIALVQHAIFKPPVLASL